MASGKTQCKATNTVGQPCQAQPVRASGYCYWHDPEISSQRTANNQRGGHNRSREARARKLLQKGMENLGDVRDVLMVSMLDVLAGKLDAKDANAVANLAGKTKDLTIGVDLEEQIAELQRRISDLMERVS